MRLAPNLTKFAVKQADMLCKTLGMCPEDKPSRLKRMRPYLLLTGGVIVGNILSHLGRQGIRNYRKTGNPFDGRSESQVIDDILETWKEQG